MGCGGAQRQAWRGRAATEAALAEVRPLEDFFAYPGPRLMKTLAERIAGDDALGVGRLVRRISGALLSGSYRYDSGEWESSDDGTVATCRIGCRSIAAAGRTGRTSKRCSSRRPGRQLAQDRPGESAACAASKTR